MTVTHVNRLGNAYHLQFKPTRTGKPNYYFGRKMTGEPVEEVPEGFEIYEDPDRGQVYLRKLRPSPILAMEREIVADGLRRYAGLKYFLVEIDGPAIVIHLPDTDERRAEETLKMLQTPAFRWDRAKQWLMANSRYSKMMQFILVDQDERLFSVECWCFRGSVDDWYALMAARGPLADLVREYTPHLGKESLFDLT